MLKLRYAEFHRKSCVSYKTLKTSVPNSEIQRLWCTQLSLKAVWPGQTSLCSWDMVTRSLLDGSFPLFYLVAQTVPPAWPVPSQGPPRGQEKACGCECYTCPNSGNTSLSSFESSGVIFVCCCYYYYFGINHLEE